MKTSGAFRTIVTAGLVVGVLDISSAFVIWWQRGVGARRGLQGIAAGLLGENAYNGGLVTAGLGLALHFFVAFVVVSVFYLASRKIQLLTIHPIVSGVLYGIGVYLVILVRLANGLSNLSTPAVERVARRCHSYFVDRVAVRIDCAPLLSTNAAIVMKDPFDFTGEVALVTGSSRGIGAEMIKAFGNRGAQCVVNYVADGQGQNK